MLTFQVTDALPDRQSFGDAEETRSLEQEAEAASDLGKRFVINTNLFF